jgi:hypothetical protein
MVIEERLPKVLHCEGSEPFKVKWSYIIRVFKLVSALHDAGRGPLTLVDADAIPTEGSTAPTSCMVFKAVIVLQEEGSCPVMLKSMAKNLVSWVSVDQLYGKVLVNVL